jgi:adenylate kinase family enzyme
MHVALASARRIVIVGGCGAGKSTLARALAERLGLPVVHFDYHYWQPGWVQPDPAEWDARTLELASGDRWVIDGNHVRTLPSRLARADVVVWLDFSTALCLRRVLLRIATTYGRVRPDMGPGCPEKIDVEFLLYVLRFRATQRPLLLRTLASYAGPLLIATDPAALRRLVE